MCNCPLGYSFFKHFLEFDGGHNESKSQNLDNKALFGVAAAPAPPAAPAGAAPNARSVERFCYRRMGEPELFPWCTGGATNHSFACSGSSSALARSPPKNALKTCRFTGRFCQFHTARLRSAAAVTDPEP